MLKRLLIALSIIALGLLIYSVFVENIFAPRLSPKDTAKITLNDLDLKVEYNRPSKRDREIFGALVPFDKVWRTGANEATTFQTNKDLMIDGMLLKKGKYTLWTVPMETRCCHDRGHCQTDSWGDWEQRVAYRRISQRGSFGGSQLHQATKLAWPGGSRDTAFRTPCRNREVA